MTEVEDCGFDHVAMRRISFYEVGASQRIEADDIANICQLRRSQMEQLELIWRGWCQDQKCPNNVWFGVKPGTRLRIKIPDGYRE